jgi:hypothetical protein
VRVIMLPASSAVINIDVLTVSKFVLELFLLYFRLAETLIC